MALALRRKRTRQPCARFLLSIVTSPANAGCGLRPRKCRTSVAPSAVIADCGDLVVAAPVPDARRIELPRQPLAAIDVALDLVRRPGLQLDMHPPELGIDQVQVIVQAGTCAAGGPPPGVGSAGSVRPRTSGRAPGPTARTPTPASPTIPLGNRPRPGLLGGAR